MLFTSVIIFFTSVVIFYNDILLLMANFTLFSQRITFPSKERIGKIIKDSGTNKYCKDYDIWSLFINIVFRLFSGE